MSLPSLRTLGLGRLGRPSLPKLERPPYFLYAVMGWTGLVVSCGGAPAQRAPEPESMADTERSSPPATDGTRVSVAPDATWFTVGERLRTIGYGPGECMFVWGPGVRPQGLRPVRITVEGTGELSGFIACDDDLDAALPPPAGVLMEWRGATLWMAHASDLGDGVRFDTWVAEMEGADEKAHTSTVVVAHQKGDALSAAVALPGLMQVTEAFGAAMLPLP